MLLKWFQGYTFKVDILPFPHWAAADFDFFSEDPARMYVNHTGSDVLTLNTICNVFFAKSFPKQVPVFCCRN